ncbi:hypothetical protein [Spiroplasma taiwanense]|uniref:hypothetical protein n=1 Tax=Spiroplasma taiwanense TaxID=2145 RepID=UPI00041EB107|nr:hypothetical protein [Spiroplasma taiwanense]
MLILTETTSVSSWLLLTFGILGLLLGIFSTIFFLRFRKKKNFERDSFNVTPGKYKFFRFWQFYEIFTLAAVGYLAALILLPIAIEQLI